VVCRAKLQDHRYNWSKLFHTQILVTKVGPTLTLSMFHLSPSIILCSSGKPSLPCTHPILTNNLQNDSLSSSSQCVPMMVPLVPLMVPFVPFMVPFVPFKIPLRPTWLMNPLLCTKCLSPLRLQRPLSWLPKLVISLAKTLFNLMPLLTFSLP
jgi:hypothetical protein